MSAGDTLYLKIGKNIVVTDRRVTHGSGGAASDQAEEVIFLPGGG